MMGEKFRCCDRVSRRDTLARHGVNMENIDEVFPGADPGGTDWIYYLVMNDGSVEWVDVEKEGSERSKYPHFSF